ncbi:MAG: ATP cone domain-containing protein, partial [Planctomycetota bacterium]|nr:ATP cone domain-containing protein [Planctomycetota bacterium]
MVRAQAEWIVRKRDGRVVPYESGLVIKAITNAFRAELNLAESQPLESAVGDEIQRMVEGVTAEIAP